MAGDNPNDGGLLQFQMQALTQHLERLMKQQNDALHKRLDQLESRGHHGEEERRERRRNESEPRQNRIEGIKLNIPPFKGRSDPEAYLKWELKIEDVFSCNQYKDDQKVKLAAAEFSDYALVWWKKLQRERVRNEEPVVDTWVEMKRIMRKRYVPASYARNEKLKLQRSSQGSKGVEEYYKELEMLMIQAKIEENEEVTMVRFINGLNDDIRDVELQEFVEIEDLLPKAIQVEQQLKRNGVARSSTNLNSSIWGDKLEKERAATSSIPAPITQGKEPSKALEQANKKSREEFQDVFSSVPSQLPPLKGIENQIDLIPGAALPNRPADRSNPQETKEIKKQVDELVSKDEADFDLRTNLLQEGGNDENMIKGKDQKTIRGLGGPMPRTRARKTKEELKQVLATIMKMGLNLDNEEPKMVNCIMETFGPSGIT